MQRRSNSQRGYSLSETLTVTAIVGLIALVTVPAMMQLMPQYRIRSAASDAGAGLRMIRQKAITTRIPWRVSFDGTQNRYKYTRLTTSPAPAFTTDASSVTSPGSVFGTSTNWVNIGRDGRPSPNNAEQWIYGSNIDIEVGTSNGFKDVDCDGAVDIIFLRDGKVARNANGGGCGGGASLTFATSPSVAFAVDNNFVRYNHYYLEFDTNGRLTIRPKKE